MVKMSQGHPMLPQFLGRQTGGGGGGGGLQPPPPKFWRGGFNPPS